MAILKNELSALLTKLKVLVSENTHQKSLLDKQILALQGVVQRTIDILDSSILSVRSQAQKLEKYIDEQVVPLIKFKPEFTTNPDAGMVESMTQTVTKIAEIINELGKGLVVNDSRSLMFALSLYEYVDNTGTDYEGMFSEFSGSSLLIGPLKTVKTKAINSLKEVRENLHPRLLKIINEYLHLWKHQKAKELFSILESFKAKAAELHIMAEHPSSVVNLMKSIQECETLRLSLVAQLTSLERNIYNLRKSSEMNYSSVKTEVEKAYKQVVEEIRTLTQHLTQTKAKLEQLYCDHIALAEKAEQLSKEQTLLSTEGIQDNEMSVTQQHQKKVTLESAVESNNPPAMVAIDDSVVNEDDLSFSCNEEVLKQYQEIIAQLECIRQKIDNAILEVSIVTRDLTRYNESEAIYFDNYYQFGQLILNKSKKDRLEIKNEIKTLQKKIDSFSRKVLNFQGKSDINSIELGILSSRIQKIKRVFGAKTFDDSHTHYLPRLRFLKSILNTNPEKYLTKHKLYSQINELKKYGESLQLSDKAKGEVSINLAKLLTVKANTYFCLPQKKQNKMRLDLFKKEFTTLLHSQDHMMEQNNVTWTQIITNIVIALSGIGVILIAGKIFYSMTSNNPDIFFFEDRRGPQRVNIIHESVDMLTAPSIY